jgi:hypothetical protein
LDIYSNPNFSKIFIQCGSLSSTSVWGAVKSRTALSPDVVAGDKIKICCLCDILNVKC